MQRVRLRRFQRIAVLAVVALLGISGVVSCSVPGSSKERDPGDPATTSARINGYRSGGYFPQWGSTGANPP